MRRHSAAAYSLFISFFLFLFQVCLEEEEKKTHRQKEREREKEEIDRLISRTWQLLRAFRLTLMGPLTVSGVLTLVFLFFFFSFFLICSILYSHIFLVSFPVSQLRRPPTTRLTYSLSLYFYRLLSFHWRMTDFVIYCMTCARLNVFYCFHCGCRCRRLSWRVKKIEEEEEEKKGANI